MASPLSFHEMPKAILGKERLVSIYKGIPDEGVRLPDGSVSWEDEAALDYVRGMMRFAWKGYETYAWGADDLRPVSRTSRNWLGKSGLAATLVDALDTLWIMGLEAEYRRAADYVLNTLSFDQNAAVSFFETVIRDLGGLLAAYALTGERQLVDKADDLGKRLIKAFQSPTGMPYGLVNLHTGAASQHGWTGGSHVLAEVGTFQLEFRYLSNVTGNPIYTQLADKVSDYLLGLPTEEPGLYPNFLPGGGGLGNMQEYSFGGLGDSYYEYLLKQWLLTGRQDKRFFKAYEDSIGVRRYLKEY